MQNSMHKGPQACCTAPMHGQSHRRRQRGGGEHTEAMQARAPTAVGAERPSRRAPQIAMSMMSWHGLDLPDERASVRQARRFFMGACGVQSRGRPADLLHLPRRVRHDLAATCDRAPYQSLTCEHTPRTAKQVKTMSPTEYWACEIAPGSRSPTCRRDGRMRSAGALDGGPERKREHTQAVQVVAEEDAARLHL